MWRSPHDTVKRGSIRLGDEEHFYRCTSLKAGQTYTILDMKFRQMAMKEGQSPSIALSKGRKNEMKRLLAAVVTVAVCLTASAQAQIGGGFGRLLPPRDANEGYKDGLD